MTKSQIVQLALAATFGVIFLSLILAIAIFIPDPTIFQYQVFRITLALAAGGIAAVIPGVLNVNIPNFVTAGGALAVFIVVYFYSPAQLAVKEVVPEPKPSPIPSASNETVVEFPEVDTNSAPGHIVAAAPYLHRVGINVTDLKPETSEVVLMNNRGLYQGDAVAPTTSQNLLTQINTGNVPSSFTLRFVEPVDSVSFIRPGLYPATKSGITHPAWSVHALDAEGNELSSQSEGLTRSFSDVPPRPYAFRAPGFDRIAALRFDSDPRLGDRPFAAFSAILIERLTLVREREKSPR